MRNVIENIRIFFDVYFRQITLLITELVLILILISVLFYIQPLATLIFYNTFFHFLDYYFIYFSKKIRGLWKNKQ